jgi:hypothetical protein
MSCYIVQEDGSGRFELEDGSGFLILETCVPAPPGGDVTAGGPLRKGRRRRLEVIDQELDWLVTVLNEV